MIVSTRNGFEIAQEEMAKINECQPIAGEQSIMIQLEMNAWAVDNDIWHASDHAIIDYRDVVDAYAELRGWKQSPVDGFELVY
jgi:hypothetical protein|tara:strand:- start:1213 stop:1461 length:249 start_codon:yes stop_codon:yes gene_type:complete